MADGAVAKLRARGLVGAGVVRVREGGFVIMRVHAGGREAAAACMRACAGGRQRRRAGTGRAGACLWWVGGTGACAHMVGRRACVCLRMVEEEQSGA